MFGQLGYETTKQKGVFDNHIYNVLLFACAGCVQCLFLRGKLPAKSVTDTFSKFITSKISVMFAYSLFVF